jgi:iron(III) transport system substrate-binding protein
MSVDSVNGRKDWRQDYFARNEVQAQFLTWLPLLLAVLVAAVGSSVWLALKGNQKNFVVIYTSQDQQFAEPILNEFAKQTGIKVRAVYDSEAVKTVGLAQRLIAEAKHPQCDLWWSNESLRTQQLARRGILDSNSIVQFGFRSRRMVINTNKLALAAAPKSLVELTNVQWRGKVALAYPMFGTTSAQFIALRKHWGAEKWEQWCRALAANKPFLVDGNSVVVRLIGRGEAAVGLTDFDDIAAGQREGLPIVALPLSEESLLIPNSVAVVHGAPHAADAKGLLQHITSDAILARLVEASALEGKSPESAAHPGVNWDALLDDLEPATKQMRGIFLR